MKKTLIVLLAFFIFSLQANETSYWKDGIVMNNDEGKRCTAGVFNNDKTFFTFNVQDSGDKREVFFEFKSGIDIRNKGQLIADLDFYNTKKQKRESIRIRFIPYSKNDKQLFILDTTVNTIYSIERLLDFMEKYHYFYMKTFDKHWVEFPFKFSLTGSTKQINLAKKSCNFKF
jgi:hypothetical protein